MFIKAGYLNSLSLSLSLSPFPSLHLSFTLLFVSVSGHAVSNAEGSVTLASSGAEGGALSTAESLAATTVTASLTQPLVADKLMWSPSTLPTTPKIKNEPQTPGLSTPSGGLAYSIGDCLAQCTLSNLQPGPDALFMHN